MCNRAELLQIVVIGFKSLLESPDLVILDLKVNPLLLRALLKSFDLLFEFILAKNLALNGLYLVAVVSYNLVLSDNVLLQEL